MTEQEFLHQIAPIPKYTAFNFAPPDFTLGIMASVRAYITFEDPEEVYVFRDKYDGYVFVDAKGIEYPAVVEFAPFQGFSKTRSKKRDIKMNTIEADSHYIAFMEALKIAETETKSESKMEFSYKLKEDTEITSTPLLEYLESKKKEKIAEKKRKADEKKKKRDDDRQARKKQVAKSIPEPIKEETKKDAGKQEQRNETKDKKKSAKSIQEKPTSSKVEPDDDGIMVRVVPSRLDRNQRKNKDEKEDSRRDRDRERKNSRRSGKNERQNEKTSGQEKPERVTDKKERSSSEKPNSSNASKVKEEKLEVKRETKRDVKLEKPSKQPASESNKDDTKDSKPKETGKREIKKYSERRKEIRARAENRRNEAEEKLVTLEQTPESLKTSSLDVSAEPFVPCFKQPLKSWVVKEGPPETVEPFPKKSDKKDRSAEEKVVDSHVESESSAMENEKSDRRKLTPAEEEKLRIERAERISKLRNKDRPSIAIYQPRRVRIAANFNDGRETKVKTPESDAKSEWVCTEKPQDKPSRERKHSKEERRKSEKRERRHHRSSGDEKSDKSIRRKKKSVTEDESREMSRQNSQASEMTESRQESGEEEIASKVAEDQETTETVVKAIEDLILDDAVTRDHEVPIKIESTETKVQVTEPINDTEEEKQMENAETPNTAPVNSNE